MPAELPGIHDSSGMQGMETDTYRHAALVLPGAGCEGYSRQSACGHGTTTWRDVVPPASPARRSDWDAPRWERCRLQVSGGAADGQGTRLPARVPWPLSAE